MSKSHPHFPKPTRSDETLRKYLRMTEQFVRRVQKMLNLPTEQRPTERQMCDFFIDLKTKVCASTWRRYEAAIRATIDYNGEWQDEILHELLSDRAKAKVRAGEALPASLKRTSKKKQKAISYQHLNSLILYLRRPSNIANRAILADFLVALAALGLRPCEWFGARYLHNFGHPILNVFNAKTSNGRRNGDEREFDLTNLSTETLGAIKRTVEWVDTFETKDSFESSLSTLAKLLTRSCEKVFPDGSVRPCFYTFRHQAIANAKATFRESAGETEAAQCVAALAGHATTQTAKTHYASSRSAWGPEERSDHCLPNPAQVERVEVKQNAPAPVYLASKHRSKK